MSRRGLRADTIPHVWLGGAAVPMAGLTLCLESASSLDLKRLDNGVLHAGVPALAVGRGLAGSSQRQGVGDALVEVELPAAEGLDALALVEVTPFHEGGAVAATEEHDGGGGGAGRSGAAVGDVERRDHDAGPPGAIGAAQPEQGALSRHIHRGRWCLRLRGFSLSGQAPHSASYPPTPCRSLEPGRGR
uniref:Uncharacterized protein n=1 Tax=Arundo donax TaxID=35708 RepID=A0A0A9HSM3_ARUDO